MNKKELIIMIIILLLALLLLHKLNENFINNCEKAGYDRLYCEEHL